MIGAIVARKGVKSGFDALYERNIDKFMKAWGDNCIWIYPGNIFALGGNNVISAQWDLELINKQGMSFSNSGVTLLTIKGAKVVQGQDFMIITDGEEYKKVWGDL